MQLNKKYKPLYSQEWDYAIIIGGRGSGKSFAVSNFVENLSFESGHIILYTRYTMASAASSVIPELNEKIELHGHDDFFHVNNNIITNKLSGSSILFSGIKTSSGVQTAKLKSIQGLTTLVIEEAEEMTIEEEFDKIDDSIRLKGVKNRILLILNPTTKESWIYKRFFQNKGIPEGFNGIHDRVLYINTDYLDNIDNLSDKFLNKANDLRNRRPEKYKHIFLGKWLEKAEGVIFDNWTIGEFNEDIIPVFGQDYGYSSDPTTLVKTAIDKKNMKIYLHECFYKPGMGTSEIAKENLRYAGNNLIIGDSAEVRLIKEIKDKGVNIKPCKKGAGSILQGIKLIEDYDLVVTPTSTNLITELNNYKWLENRIKPIDKYNHLIDSIRYSCSHQLFVSTGKYSIV